MHDWRTPSVRRSGTRQQLSLRFTGSGSEYFRIWIVNLLLTVVTCGIYFPFAKARKLRYFHENTLVADSPLSFHGDPKRMLRGYLLIGVLFVAYSVLTRAAPLVAGLMLLLGMPLMPLLLWSALRFRLGQTGWRGLRFQFDGSLRDAYLVFWPIALPLAAVLLGQALLAPTGEEASFRPSGNTVMLMSALAGLGTLTLVLLTPWIHWRFKRYQHGHYRLGSEVTRLTTGFGEFYRTQLRIGGLGLLCMLALGIGFAVLVPTVRRSPLLLAGLTPLAYLAVSAVLGGYLLSRMQNLIWGHTRSDHIRFRSDLPARPLMTLLLKNAVLMLLTLGLYWPFAVIAVTRMRLEAIRIDLNLPLEQITGSAVGTRSHSAGEAAADLNPLGFDIDL